MGVVGQLACQDFLIRKACSGGWSCISSLLSARNCPVVSFEMSVGLA